MPVRPAIAALILLACVSAIRAEMPPGSIRAVVSAGPRVWAVGDRGTVLASDDDGRSFAAPAAACPFLADWRGAAAAGESTLLLAGGRAEAGLAPLARGVIVRTDDNGQSWSLVTDTLPGMLYGVATDATGGRILAWGQAGDACPSGIWYSASGRLFSPVETAGQGSVLAGSFPGLDAGLLVGGDHRVVSLRGLAEPPIRPGFLDNPAALRAVCLTADETAWAVGDDGSVLVKPRGQADLQIVTPRLPAPVRRLADFEAAAFWDGQRGLIGGGLLGAVLRTTDGESFTPRPAPAGTPLHCLALTADGTVLAGGDHGRIWRSTDAADTWTLVHGRDATDLLLVASPVDPSVLTVAAAHALAGANVTVCYLAGPPASPTAPSRQALELACSVVGAACLAPNDFASLAAGQGPPQFTAADLVNEWSARLDRPGRQQAVQALAAVIRLTRPSVLATGVHGRSEFYRGRTAEAFLLSELALEAAARSADEQAWPDLDVLLLRPHQVRRVATGKPENIEYRPPWAEPLPPPDAKAVHLGGSRYAAGSDEPVGLYALRAAAALPWLGLADRPPAEALYAIEDAPKRYFLLTDDVTDIRWRTNFEVRTPPAVIGGGILAVAEKSGQGVAAALAPVANTARAVPEDAQAADVLYLAWGRLCEQGKLVQSVEARTVFLEHGQRHPRFEQANVAAVAQIVSAEWAGQIRREGLARPITADQLRVASDRLAKWPHWQADPAVLLLLGRAETLLGRKDLALAAYRKVLEAPFAGDFAPAARTEMAAGKPPREAAGQRTLATLAYPPGKLDVDGRLEESFWAAATPLPLSDALAQPAAGDVATVRAVVADRHLVLGLHLRRWPEQRRTATAPAGAMWTVEAALDADRDAWTDLRFQADTDANRAATLHTRGAPTVTLRDGFAVQAQADAEAYTFELAIPLADAGLPPGAETLAGFQLRLTAVVPGETAPRVYRFASHAGTGFQPHCYGLLHLQRPAAQDPAPAPSAD